MFIKRRKPRIALLTFLSAVIVLLSEIVVVAAPENSSISTSQSNRLIAGDGKVWVIDNDGSVRQASVGNKHFANTLPSEPIAAVYVNHNLYQVVGNELRFFNAKDQEYGVVAGLPHKGPWLLTSTEREMWLASGDELYRIKHENLLNHAVLEPVNISLDEIAYLSSEGDRTYIASYRNLYQIQEGKLAAINLPIRNAITGVWATGKGVIVASGSQLTSYSLNESNTKTVFTGLDIRDVLSYNNTLFVVTEKGLFVWNPDEMEEPAFSSPFSLNGQIAIDEYARAWVSDERGVRTLWASNLVPTKSRSLPSTGTVTLIGEKGVYWARGGKIIRSDGHLNELAQVRVSGDITSLVERNAVLWATVSGRLYSFDTQTLERLYLTVPNQVESAYLNQLFIDDFNTLWLSGTGELFRWWPETGTVNSIHTYWADGESAHTKITSFVDTGKYGIWIGSNQGLYQYVHGSFFRFLPNIRAIDNIHFDGKNLLYVESLGQKWQLVFANNSSELIQEKIALDAVPVCRAKPAQGQWAVYSNNVVFNGEKWTSWKSEKLKGCGIFGDALITVSEAEISSTPIALVRDILSESSPSFSVTPFSEDDRQSWPELYQGVEHTLLVQSEPMLPHVGLTYQIESAEGVSEWKYAPHGHITDLAEKEGTFILHIHQSVPPYAHTDVRFSVKSRSVFPAPVAVGMTLVCLVIAAGVFVYRRRIDDEGRISHEQVVRSSLDDAEFLQQQLNTVEASKEVTAVRQSSMRLLKTAEPVCDNPRRISLEVSDPSDFVKSVLPSLTAVEDWELEHADNNPDVLRYAQWQDQVEEIVGERYSDSSFSLADLADCLHLSERSVQRRFQAAYKQTFREFLTQYRLERAAEMLAKENCLVSDIAEACGFNELSYFGARFKARYGETPSNYMRRFQQQV